MKRLAHNGNYNDMTLYDIAGNPIINSSVTLAAEKQEKVKKMLIELATQSQNLTKKTLDTWRKAWQTAIIVDNPRRNSLYAVYTDVDVDLHLTGAISQIKNTVLKRSLKVVDRKTKKEKPELTELLQDNWFKELLGYALDSRYWGHSLVQFGDLVTIGGRKRFTGVELIPREHVSPEFGVILKEPGDEFAKGASYRDGKIAQWVVEIGKTRDLGLFLKIAPHAISKKFMCLFWDQAGEIFGMPIRIGKTSSSNPRELSKVEKMLSEMGAAAYGLFPEGTEIEIKESQKGDYYMVYDKRIERANSEMSKGVLTVTMTMDNGSSLSQSEVHDKMLQATVDSEAGRILDVINNIIIPKIAVFGFPFTENDMVVWDIKKEYKPAEQVAIETMVLSNYDIDPQYFIDNYNIPVTGRKQFQSQPALGLEKKNLKLAYIDEIYQPCPDCGGFKVELAASSGLDMSALRDKFLARVYAGHAKDIDPEIINATSIELKNGMVKGYGSNFEDVTIDSNDFEMLSNLENSVYSFSAAKNYQELKVLTDLITDSSGAIRPFSEFRAEAEKVFKSFNEDWLSTEYGTAINGAMQASRWADYTRNKKAMSYLRYVTAGDSRVRDSHRSLDGVVKRIDDNFWNSYYPPNGYNCRCTTTQTGQSRETPEGSVNYPSVNPMFKTNLAKQGLIFPKGHPYYDGVPIKLFRKALAYLPPENTFRTVKVADNAFIDVHPLHGEKELKKNIEAARIIKMHLPNADIKLNPILNEADYDELSPKFYSNNKRHGKNPDITLNGALHEIEVSSNASKASIHNAIRDGKEQCDRIIIRLPDDADMALMHQLAKGQIRWHDNIEEVWIMNKSEWLTIDGKGIIKQKRALPK